MPIIEVNNVTKEFKLGELKSLKHIFSNALNRLRGNEVERIKPLKALDDVSFTVESGEVLGIIGQNGSGKSTLLKMLARISKPTRGEIKVNGTVAPLIEVGAGLIGDMTGRENIFLNGAIFGLSRAEIKKQFDGIVAFAELEQFIDTPIKRYSSGMSVRLAFAIATCVNAAILIIDEVLAVGDLAFQRKCFDRMEEMIKTEGKTVLLVSHNIRQVERLCTRAILLEHGRISFDGVSSHVCSLFYEQANAKIASFRIASNKFHAYSNTSGEVDVLSIDLMDDMGNRVESIPSGGKLKLRVRFQLYSDLRGVELIIGTHSTDFVYLSAGSTGVYEPRPDLSAGVHEVEYILSSFPLVPGVYCVRFSLYDGNKRPVFVGEALETFKVTPISNELREPGSRILHIPAKWRLDGQTYPSSAAVQSTNVHSTYLV